MAANNTQETRRVIETPETSRAKLLEDLWNETSDKLKAARTPEARKQLQAELNCIRNLLEEARRVIKDYSIEKTMEEDVKA